MQVQGNIVQASLRSLWSGGDLAVSPEDNAENLPRTQTLNFKTNLRLLREHNGLSRREVCKKFREYDPNRPGQFDPHFSRWEDPCNKIKPGSDYLSQLTTFFEVTSLDDWYLPTTSFLRKYAIPVTDVQSIFPGLTDRRFDSFFIGEYAIFSLGSEHSDADTVGQCKIYRSEDNAPYLRFRIAYSLPDVGEGEIHLVVSGFAILSEVHLFLVGSFETIRDREPITYALACGKPRQTPAKALEMHGLILTTETKGKTRPVAARISLYRKHLNPVPRGFPSDVYMAPGYPPRGTFSEELIKPLLDGNSAAQVYGWDGSPLSKKP